MAKRLTVLLIDSNALVHRAYHALPATMITAKGELTNAVYGFTTALFHALATVKPDMTICCFDVAGETFRHHDYDQYKAHRKGMEDDLAAQLPRIYDLIRAFGIPIVSKEGYEADDCIGTLTTYYEKVAEVIILTGDKDELQLISPHVSVMLLKQGLRESRLVDLAALQKEYGLTPSEFIVYKALRGDQSDNIPGIPGVGEVTALKLVQTYHDIEHLYYALDQSSDNHPLLKGKLREALATHRKLADLSHKLATIAREVPLGNYPKNVTDLEPDFEHITKLFDELEFRSLRARLEQVLKIPAQERSDFRLDIVNQAEFRAFLKKAVSVKLISLAFLVEGQDVVAVAASVNGTEGDGIAWDAKVAELLKPVLVSHEIEKRLWDIKSTNHHLSHFRLEITPPYFDVMIADALLQSRAEVPSPIVLKSKPGNDDLHRLIEHACRTFVAADELGATLDQTSMTDVWEQIECPLIPVIFAMEVRGVMVDHSMLKKLSGDMDQDLKRLGERIWHYAGQEFNVASPQQLSTILFEKLQLGHGGMKKKATGYSTDAATLESLRLAHPIIDFILKYREIAKLKGTYVDVFPKLIDANGRLHTTYNQIGAATGRLSSNDPNLQNIPARTALGQKIRRAFVAAVGYKLLSFDYSQFELRILAHLSGDEAMCRSFASDVDIHLVTAAKLQNVPLDKVTKEMRRAAKAVNFGILYGLSAHSLSQQLEIPFDQAKGFIDRYFTLYPRVKTFLRDVVEQARRDGHYYTLCGRRRLFPELASSVWSVRQAGERMAMNFPMQGTQADLLKLAMVKVARSIFSSGLDANLLLTVHDELVFEVAEKDIQAAAALIRNSMTSIYTLTVPIKVSGKVGANWSDMEELS